MPQKSPSAGSRFGVGLLRSELTREVLAALADKGMTQGELKGWLVLASGSTLHRHLAELSRVGLISKARTPGEPRRTVYRLTEAGGGLVEVMGAVEAWIGRHPRRADELAGPVGWRAFLAFAEAWASGLLPTLLERPCGEPELLGALDGPAGEKLRREIRALLGAELLARTRRGGVGPKRLALAPWSRLGFGPFATLLRWERSHFGSRAAPIRAEDGATALVACLPVLRLHHRLNGACALAVEGDGERGSEDRGASAVWATVRAGLVTGCLPQPADLAPDAWARGGIDTWFAAVLDAKPRQLQLGGDEALAVALLAELHRYLCVAEGPVKLSTEWDRGHRTDPHP